MADGGRALAVPVAAGEPRPPPQTHYLLRSEHPQVEITWSTALLSERPKPDTLKLRKRVQAWPLEFTFKVGCGSVPMRHAGRQDGVPPPPLPPAATAAAQLLR